MSHQAVLDYSGVEDVVVVKPLKIPRRLRDRRGYVEVVVVHLPRVGGGWRITVWPSINLQADLGGEPLGVLQMACSCNGPVISAAEKWLRDSCKWVSKRKNLPKERDRFVIK